MKLLWIQVFNSRCTDFIGKIIFKIYFPSISFRRLIFLVTRSASSVRRSLFRLIICSLSAMMSQNISFALRPINWTTRLEISLGYWSKAVTWPPGHCAEIPALFPIALWTGHCCSLHAIPPSLNGIVKDMNQCVFRHSWRNLPLKLSIKALSLGLSGREKFSTTAFR